MVQKTPAAKKVNIAALTTKVYGVWLKNKDGTIRRLPPAKYSGSAYKMPSAKQKEWLWQDHKKAKGSGQDIPAANGGCAPPANKHAKRLASAVNSHCNRIDNLTAQNKRLIAALSRQGIDIPKSDDLSNEEGEDCKMAANRKNSSLTKTKNKQKS